MLELLQTKANEAYRRATRASPLFPPSALRHATSSHVRQVPQRDTKCLTKKKKNADGARPQAHGLEVMRFIGSWPRGEVDIGEDEGGKNYQWIK